MRLYRNSHIQKPMVPFCTSRSSGIGSSDTNLHALAADAKWLSGRRFAGGTSKDTMEECVNSVTAARRGGALQAIDTMNHFFLNHEMYVVGSTYWNMVYGQMPGDVEKDQEGIDGKMNGNCYVNRYHRQFPFLRTGRSNILRKYRNIFIISIRHNDALGIK